MFDWLAAIQQLWLTQIKAAEEAKEKHFGKQASRAWGFLEKSYSKLHLIPDEEGDGEPRAFADVDGPRHRVRRNLAREYVNLMMPYVFAQIPHRLVTPRRPPLPPELVQLFGESQQLIAGMPAEMAESLGSYMLTHYLNWIPREYGLSDEVRMGLPEALVKGRAVFWYSLQDTASGPMPVTEYDTVDYMLIDPDCEHYRDAAYVIRKRRLSAWRLSKLTGVPAAKIRREYASYSSKSDNLNAFANDDRSDESDTVEYYEVYSRYGIGAQLPNIDKELEGISSVLESLGPFIYLVIVPGMKYPLNVTPEAFGDASLEAEFKARLAWPLPVYETFDPWPCTVMDFSPNSLNPWAASPLQGALPLLIFLDHAYSWMMGRIRTSSRDLILCAAEMESELNRGIESGVDQEILTASMATIAEVEKYIHVLQFPEIKADFWNVISKVEQAFERASGMTALLYGETGGRQMRSAAEADIREGHAVSRAEYLAECVESTMSKIAAKEAVITRLFVPPPFALFGEVAPEGGAPDMTTPLSLYWGALVNTDNPAEAVGEYTYSVEAGSARRKNKQAQIADMQMLTQFVGPIQQQSYALTGDSSGMNYLIGLMGQAMDMPVTGLMLPQLTPQPPMPPGEEASPEEQQPSQAEEIVQ